MGLHTKYLKAKWGFTAKELGGGHGIENYHGEHIRDNIWLSPLDRVLAEGRLGDKTLREGCEELVRY